MSNFRSKREKCSKDMEQATLDKTHKNIMSAFIKEESELAIQIAQSDALMKKVTNNSFKNQEEKKNALDKIAHTKQQMEQFKKRKHKYLLDNSKIIFKYFNMKKQSETNTVKNETGTNKDSSMSYGKQKVMAFFKKATTKMTELDILTNTHNDNLESESNLVSKYLSNIDENYINTNASMTSSVNHLCMYCKKGKLLVSDDDGLLVCNLCAASVTYIPENEKQSYKDPPKEVGTFIYQRSNHFKEILTQFQAKETTYIADVIIERCRQQIKKERLQFTNEHLTYYKMRDILRDLGYDSKLYEHIAFIKNKLGVPPPVLSRELEMKLCKMFDETLVPFSKHNDDSRSNYIHYYFVLYKMYELLGETRYAKDIPMLKEPAIFMSQDDMWKKICRELNWKFIPTSFENVGGVV